MCECMCVNNRIMFPMLAGQQPDRMSREQRSFPSLNIHIRAYTTFNTSPLCRNEFDRLFHVIRGWKGRLWIKSAGSGSTCPCRSVHPEWLSQWLESSCCGWCLRIGCCSIRHKESRHGNQWRELTTRLPISHQLLRGLCTHSGRGRSFLMVSGDQRAGRDFTGAAWTGDVLTVALRSLGGNRGACGRKRKCLRSTNQESQCLLWLMTSGMMLALVCGSAGLLIGGAALFLLRRWMGVVCEVSA